MLGHIAVHDNGDCSDDIYTLGYVYNTTAIRLYRDRTSRGWRYNCQNDGMAHKHAHNLFRSDAPISWRRKA